MNFILEYEWILDIQTNFIFTPFASLTLVWIKIITYDGDYDVGVGDVPGAYDFGDDHALFVLED